MIEKKLIDYLSTKKEIQAAYLYGSMAKGDVWNESDIDIAILTSPLKTRKESFHLRLTYIKELQDLLAKEVDVVLLRKCGELLSEEIIRRGKLILEADKNAHREFLAHRIIQCVDFKFLEKKAQKGMLQAIKEGK